MKVRLVMEIEATEANPHLPESMQLRDLAGHVMHRLGFGPPRAPGHPVVTAARITESTCLSSNRHSTPVEGAVISATEEITRKIVIDAPEPRKPRPKKNGGNGNGK